MRVARYLFYLSGTVALGIPLADWLSILETTFNPVQVAASIICLLSSGAFLIFTRRSKMSENSPALPTLVAAWGMFLGALIWLGLITYYLGTIELMGH